MKNILPVLLLLSTVCVLAQASETPTRTEPIIPSAELTELRARVSELEAVIVRTGDNGENVEIRAPSLRGTVSLVDGAGNKIIEIQRREGIPGDFQALGFFGHLPMGQDGISGDWNLGSPDEWNQNLVIGSAFDALGDNLGYGLLQDRRLNYARCPASF